MGPRHLLPVLLLSLVVAACSAPMATTSPTTSAGAATPAASTPAASPSASASAEASYPITLTDDAGRELELTEAPQRIVSLAPSNSEIVCALDACDRLVGVTDFDDYPPEVTDIDPVVIQAQVDVERVVAAEPDLVLAAGNEITPSSVIAQIDELGLPTLVVYPETLDEVYADIELIGRAIGASAEAEAVIGEMQSRVADVVASVEGAERPSVLYEVFYSEGTIYTAGEGSFLASLIELAGAEPVTGDAQGLLAVEELVEADPDIILLGTASYDPSLADEAAALASVAGRPGWGDLAAVRDERVIPFTDDIVTTRPGPRVVQGLEALAAAIHPELAD